MWPRSSVIGSSAADEVEYLAPPDPPQAPQKAPPVGACDCHAHVFGPFDRFPLAPERPYTPAELPAERYLRMLDRIGFNYGVLVQPVAYKTDCRALLNALDRAPNRLRGVVLVRSDITDEELKQMHLRGVLGARFSEPPPGLAQGGVGFDVLESLAPRLAYLGWHAQIWAPCHRLGALVQRLAPLGLPLVVDHMGYFDPSQGLDGPEFKGLLKLLRDNLIWLKLTAYRLSARYPDYDDLAPFHRALVEANSDRLIWGSDWPHVHMTEGMPDVGHLVDLFDRWLGHDEALRRRILVDNPAALYGF
ncbi:MAG TPA: amidohydrolase family protein [Steroidobacteraceae bacterium]|nr:amidohydrolase family protein [Steroidobacteraceae bacterium]